MQHHRVLVENVGRHARYLCCSCGKEITQTNSKPFSQWAKEVQVFKVHHPFDFALFQVGGCKITLGRILKSARAERNWTAEETCEAITQVAEAISVDELLDIEESVTDVRLPAYNWLIDCAIAIFDFVEDDRPWLEKLRVQTYLIEP